MENLCKIRNLQRAIASFETRFEQRYGICLNEGMALCSLHKAKTLSAGELGEVLGLSSSNTSKVLASVEKKGLVVRELGQKDKRRIYYALTDGGLQLMSVMRCPQEDMPELLIELIQP